MRGRGWIAGIVVVALGAGAWGCNAILGINDPIHAEETDAQPPADASSEAAPDQATPDSPEPDVGQPDSDVPDQASPDGEVGPDAPGPDGETPLQAREVGAGDNHSCAVMSDTTVKCWGLGFHGALGNNDEVHQKSPVVVVKTGGTPLTGAARVDGGRETTCALMTGGTVTCWGLNSSGQYGDGTSTNHFTADSGPALTGVTALSVGFAHVCAVASGSAFCWGANAYRKAGPDQISWYLKPNQISNMSGVTAVAAGYDHSCAVHSGAVSCWGNNNSGQLGNNSAENSDFPVAVMACGTQTAPIEGVQAIAAGARHTCALRADQTVWCWGDGSDGALGTGKLDPSLCAIKVASLSKVEKIATGTNHTCAVATGGDMWCWGRNGDGEIGDGTKLDVPVPNNVLDNVASIGLGDAHTCAAKADGTAWCWGSNLYGQLGTGDNAERLKPAQVTF